MTAAIDSRTPALHKDANVYVTSEFPYDTWLQPPSSHYVFVVDGVRMRGHLIQGIYVHLSSPFPTLEDLLIDEFRTWEAASDDDMAKFDADLE